MPEKDVIVVGGGPAGTTTAALVAEQGYDVTLFERNAEPTFKIGESLMPGTYWTFKRLGLLEKLSKTAYPRKYSVQFYGASGRASAPFYFNQNDSNESSVTWQVLRSDFDRMMQEHAAEKGADVVLGASVLEVLFEGERASGVRVRMANGDIEEMACRVVVDASGQSALLSRKLKISRSEPTLKKASVFTHFENGVRDKGIDEGATLILNTSNKDSWFWYIPLPENRVSVGVVGDIDYLFGDRALDAQTLFGRELALCAPMVERLSSATQVFPMKTTRDFSYRADRIAGEGWVLVGDAFGFLDPVYSSGIFLALKSGEMAGDAIVEGLRTDDLSEACLGRFCAEYLKGMESIRKLVYAFYSSDFNFGTFLKAYPDCQQEIVDILSGKVYDVDVTPLFESMSKMCVLPESSWA